MTLAVIVFLGFASFVLLSGNAAYGMWIPESAHGLLEKSATVFVGNITDTKVLQFEKHWSGLVSENGTDKPVTGNYTLNLDEYTVNVEQYLKNPQNSTKMTVRQPTVGLMRGLGPLDGFKTGDHVLFYVEKIDGNNTYSPESFIIPTFCNATDVITQKRPIGGNEFNVTQNGISVDYGNFTAGKQIQFLSSKDMGTLSGKSFEVLVGISKVEGQRYTPVFSKDIHTSSKPCEWTATAEWGFAPQEGNYNMDITTKEGGIITGTSDTEFSVRSDAISKIKMSPLQQFKSGTAAKDVACKKGLDLLIRTEDGSPACVRYTTADLLINRGWAREAVSTMTSLAPTVIIPVNSSLISNGFTFAPTVVKTIIGINNTVRWINLDSVVNDVTSDTNSFKSGLIEPGYAWMHIFDKPGTYGYHSVIHPWLKGTVTVIANPLASLENDTGTVTFGNQTYYFETPNYTNDAYFHPVQVSFHDVVFTLFPSGFKGGLPESCGATYYWTGARFSDNASELLHIFAGPKCPVLPPPTYFSTHTNPQAGLTFYDGKMKLLVSNVISNSSGR